MILPAVATKETPPRMWGILTTNHGDRVVNGNTPTHVGNTLCDEQYENERKKHPHACGEYATFVRWNSPMIETPPRMWGIQQHLVHT